MNLKPTLVEHHTREVTGSIDWPEGTAEPMPTYCRPSVVSFRRFLDGRSEGWSAPQAVIGTTYMTRAQWRAYAAAVEAAFDMFEQTWP